MNKYDPLSVLPQSSQIYDRHLYILQINDIVPS